MRAGLAPRPLQENATKPLVSAVRAASGREAVGEVARM